MSAMKSTVTLLGLLAALALGACGTSPPVQLYQLRADPPGYSPAQAPAAPALKGTP